MRCTPRASNGPNRLGLCVLQTRKGTEVSQVHKRVFDCGMWFKCCWSEGRTLYYECKQIAYRCNTSPPPPTLNTGAPEQCGQVVSTGQGQRVAADINSSRARQDPFSGPSAAGRGLRLIYCF